MKRSRARLRHDSDGDILIDIFDDNFSATFRRTSFVCHVEFGFQLASPTPSCQNLFAAMSEYQQEYGTSSVARQASDTNHLRDDAATSRQDRYRAGYSFARYVRDSQPFLTYALAIAYMSKVSRN